MSTNIVYNEEDICLYEKIPENILFCNYNPNLIQCTCTLAWLLKTVYIQISQNKLVDFCFTPHTQNLCPLSFQASCNFSELFKNAKKFT